MSNADYWAVTTTTVEPKTESTTLGSSLEWALGLAGRLIANPEIHSVEIVKPSRELDSRPLSG